MAVITKVEWKTSEQYQLTKPRQFGNLHERMQYAMECLRNHPELSRDPLWHALFDLEVEVEFYTPQDPPYGIREFQAT